MIWSPWISNIVVTPVGGQAYWLSRLSAGGAWNRAGATTTDPVALVFVADLRATIVNPIPRR
jgi:hypothetical protein